MILWIKLRDNPVIPAFVPEILLSFPFFCLKIERMESSVQFTYTAAFLWMGVYQGLILSPVLWFRREGNELANKLLATLIFMFSLRILITIYQFSGSSIYPNFWTLNALPITLLYGPLYYLYLKSYIERGFRLRWPYWYHFFPGLLAFIFSWTVLLFFLPDDMEVFESMRRRELPGWILIFPILVILQTSFYIILGFRLLLKYYLYVKSEASSSEDQYFRWLAGLNLILLFPVFSVILTLVLLRRPILARIYPFPALGITLMLASLGIISMVRPSFLQGLPESLRVDEEEDLSPARYESSSLAEDSKVRYHRKLARRMKEEQPFLEQDLTLSELSRRLGINTKYLSQVINEVEGMNFMDYINSHRIERAKELLQHPSYEYHTVLAIAQEVGFKSKSAFYNAFKKFTGLTPAAWKKTEKRHQG